MALPPSKVLNNVAPYRHTLTLTHIRVIERDQLEIEHHVHFEDTALQCKHTNLEGTRRNLEHLGRRKQELHDKRLYSS